MDAGKVRGQPKATLPELPEEAAQFRNKVLGWLDSMHISGGPVWEYRMTANSDTSVFTSCFAVFIRHLFRDLARLSEGEKQEWLAYLRGFQDPKSGLFLYPEASGRVLDIGHDEEHLNRQLTTYCLSAMDALGGEPRYPFKFLEPWKEPDRLVKWLDGLWWDRPWNCGNKVMFMAVFFAYSWEHWKDEASRKALDVWFDWHDRHQKPSTGFWGTSRDSEYYAGMGGSYHEFVIYNYFGRKINYADRVVGRNLLLQQPDGLYTPQQGGGSCDDIDGIDSLVHFYHQHNYRRDEIRASLQKSLSAILASQNPDGGFCWAKPYYFKPHDYLRVATDIFRHGHPYLWYWNIRRGIRDQRPAAQNRPVLTGWTQYQRKRWESALFDTWLRCVTIGEIASVLTEHPLAALDWQFLAVPGVGWFRKDKES